MIPRQLFEAEHESFRASVRRFMAEEVMPQHPRYEQQGFVDLALWRRAGELGLLCTAMPDEYGGAGADRLFSAILIEEQARAGATGLGFALHSDIVAPYILRYGSTAQKRQWLPPMASGQVIAAIAMTEPGTGSDLQSIKTSAVEEGDDYVVNGSKIFITNGWNCNLAIVAVKTGVAGGGAKDVSLLLIEADRRGFGKGKPLQKIGMKAQDTCELFFDHVRVPRSNLLGEPGSGFAQLMQQLAWERLIIAIISVAGAEAALEQTIAYTRQRHAFGRPIANFQNTRFKLAELASEVQIARVFVDRCLQLELTDDLSIEAAAAAKYWTSDLLSKVVDECVQLHGGYGYMLDYPIARAYIDSRAQRIYGGTNEIMKEIIARSL